MAPRMAREWLRYGDCYLLCLWHEFWIDGTFEFVPRVILPLQLLQPLVMFAEYLQLISNISKFQRLIWITLPFLCHGNPRWCWERNPSPQSCIAQRCNHSLPWWAFVPAYSRFRRRRDGSRFRGGGCVEHLGDEAMQSKLWIAMKSWMLSSCCY